MWPVAMGGKGLPLAEDTAGAKAPGLGMGSAQWAPGLGSSASGLRAGGKSRKGWEGRVGGW